MSLRNLVLLSSAVTLALSAAVIILGIGFIHAYILNLLPSDLVPVVGPGVRAVLVAQAVALLVFAVVLSIISYAANTHLIYRPLREVAGVMEAFASTGETRPLPSLRGAPHEVQTLGNAFADVTKRVEAAHAHDMEISRVKSDFISTAAHQLRTPLTAIRWALEALQREPLTPEQQELVKSAVDKSHDLVSIVGTLLDISSIESGKYQYKYAPVSMQSLAAEVTKDFQPLAAERQVHLVFAPAGAELPPARADRERVKWVLNNLVENAIRYTPSGGSVTVSVAPAPGRVQVAVRDTGIGIQPQDRANIFERFYRAGNAIAKENAGNGLGLYIARTIATDHGGDLNFQPNQEGVGTTFTLSLPLAS